MQNPGNPDTRDTSNLRDEDPGVEQIEGGIPTERLPDPAEEQSQTETFDEEGAGIAAKE